MEFGNYFIYICDLYFNTFREGLIKIKMEICMGGGVYFIYHIVTVIIVKTYKTVLNLRYLFYMLGKLHGFLVEQI